MGFYFFLFEIDGVEYECRVPDIRLFSLLSVFPFYYYLRYLVRNNRSFVFVAIVFLLSVFYILKVTVFASAEYQYESVYFS